MGDDLFSTKLPYKATVVCIQQLTLQYWGKVSNQPPRTDKALNPDLVFYLENSSFFLDIIGRDETFSELGFQVSGVRCQAGFRFFPTDT